MRDWRAAVRRSLAGERIDPSGEADLIEELAQHLEQRYEELVARGASAAEAEREVLAELGTGDELMRAAGRRAGTYRELPAVGEGGGRLGGIGQDLRMGLRLLRRNPVFALAAVLTLAIGIGANAAIFGVVDAVLLRGSPFAAADELVIVWETDRASGTTHEPASWPDVLDFRERSRTLADVAIVRASAVTLLSAAAEPARLQGVAVTPNFFELLGVRPLIGSGFQPGHGAVGTAVMLSDHLWRSRFNADTSVIGSSISVNGTPAVVVGVVASSVDLGMRQLHTRADYGAPFHARRADLWLAFQPTAERFPRSTHPFLTLGRLAPGSSVAAAQRELAAIATELENAYPENDERGVNVQSFGDVVFGSVRPALLLLLIAAGLVLLVTCANVANLLLARTSERMREVAVRRALGASSARIARQLLLEAVVLTGIGAAGGVALAWLALRLLVAFAPADVPRLADAALDARVLAFTVATAALVAIVFGGIPALRVRLRDLRSALQAQPGRVTDSAGARAVRSALVVGQVALAVALFAAAGLLLRSYAALQSVDPGFRADGVLKAGYSLPGNRYPADRADWPHHTAITRFHGELARRVSALPGVLAAAVTAQHPLEPGYTNSFLIVGREAESEDFPEIRTRAISPGYLATTGVPLLAGRDISAADDALAPRVGLLNRAAVERYFSGGDPLGQRLRFWGVEWLIVGVIGDERFKGIDQASEPAIYTPLSQSPEANVTLLVRTRRDPLASAPQLMQTIRQLDPEVPMFGVEMLEQTVAATMARPRFITALLGVFSAVTVFLALIGVHGLLAYTVAQRSRELSIRVALGATRQQIRRMVLVQGFRLALGGVVLGIGTALLGARLLAALLFGVAPTDPATFALVTAIVLLTATAAAWLPARRATAVSPMHALRE